MSSRHSYVTTFIYFDDVRQALLEVFKRHCDTAELSNGYIHGRLDAGGGFPYRRFDELCLDIEKVLAEYKYEIFFDCALMGDDTPDILTMKMWGVYLESQI